MDHFCEKCKRSKDEKQFYLSNNLEKYPDNGMLNQCKDCLTMFVDNWDQKTYLWILEECDVPYIQEEWNKLMATYAKDPSKVTGKSIIGRYLSKMKLKQFRDYRWKDNELIREMAAMKVKQTMERQGYSEGEIQQAIEQGVAPAVDAAPPPPPPPQESSTLGPQDDYFSQINGGAEEDDLASDLTDEDRTYLRLKWGKTYRPDEWVRLEQLYNEMMESYDIQSAGHIDTLKLVCKTSLKANQLLDIGDVDGAQKMVKMYDSLMKSGKFTANQNKTESGEFVDSISELVALCEQEGFIPRYYTSGPMDKVDETLADLKGYTKTLVTEEMNLGTLIEDALKNMVAMERKEEDSEDDIELDVVEELDDSDFEEFNSLLEEEAAADAQEIGESDE